MGIAVNRFRRVWLSVASLFTLGKEILFVQNLFWLEKSRRKGLYYLFLSGWSTLKQKAFPITPIDVPNKKPQISCKTLFFYSGGTQLITINWSDWKFLLKNRRAFSFSVGLSTLYVCFGAKWNKQFPTPPPPLLSKSVNPYELVLAEEPYFPGIWDLRISRRSRFFRTNVGKMVPFICNGFCTSYFIIAPPPLPSPPLYDERILCVEVPFLLSHFF